MEGTTRHDSLIFESPSISARFLGEGCQAFALHGLEVEEVRTDERLRVLQHLLRDALSVEDLHVINKPHATQKALIGKLATNKERGGMVGCSGTSLLPECFFFDDAVQD